MVLVSGTPKSLTAAVANRQKESLRDPEAADGKYPALFAGSARPIRLPIERDLRFESKGLRELMEKHRRDMSRLNLVRLRLTSIHSK